MMKFCRRCKTEKKHSEFPKASNPKKGDRYGLCSWCKNCYKEYASERRKKPDYKNIRNAWMEKIGGNSGFYSRYKSVIRKAHQKYIKKDKSKELHAIVEHKRRASKRGSSQSFTTEQWSLVKNYYSPDNVCLSCKKVTIQEMEHVVPLSAGETNDIRNIQPLCPRCNQKKRTKTIDYRPDGGAFANSVYLCSEAR
jgi:5-methylcytosine-specific restriction endonuclease McrA